MQASRCAHAGCTSGFRRSRISLRVARHHGKIRRVPEDAQELFGSDVQLGDDAFLCAPCNAFLCRLRNMRTIPHAKPGPTTVLVGTATLPLVSFALPQSTAGLTPRSVVLLTPPRLPRNSHRVEPVAPLSPSHADAAAAGPSWLTTACVFSGEKVQALVDKHVRCPCGSAVQMTSLGSRAGGRGDLGMHCVEHGHPIVMRSTVTLATGPIRDREAFLQVAQHLLSGHNYSTYARCVRASGAPVSEDAYRNTMTFLMPALQAVRFDQRQRFRLKILQRPPTSPGAADNFVAAHDCAWHKRSKRNHCGNSPHATYFLLDYFSGGIVSSTFITKDKKSTVADIPAFKKSSQAMEDEAHVRCLRDFVVDNPDIKLRASIKDGDVRAVAATGAALAGLNYGKVHLLRCRVHYLRTLDKRFMEVASVPCHCPSKKNKDGSDSKRMKDHIAMDADCAAQLRQNMETALEHLDGKQTRDALIARIQDLFLLCCEHVCNVHAIKAASQEAPPVVCWFHDVTKPWGMKRGQNISCPEQRKALRRLFFLEILPHVGSLVLEGVGTVTTNRVESAFSELRRFKNKDENLSGDTFVFHSMLGELAHNETVLRVDNNDYSFRNEVYERAGRLLGTRLIGKSGIQREATWSRGRELRRRTAAKPATQAKTKARRRLQLADEEADEESDAYDGEHTGRLFEQEVPQPVPLTSSGATAPDGDEHVDKKRASMRCGACGQVGHSKRTCEVSRSVCAH